MGLAVGGFLGIWHLVWSLLVLAGLAQPLMDFVFKLHMMDLSFTVLPFSLSMAIGLIVVTSLFGYILGYVLGLIWDMVQKKS
jgi:hypothetical protein